jgi:hypothetical protein
MLNMCVNIHVDVIGEYCCADARRAWGLAPQRIQQTVLTRMQNLLLPSTVPSNKARWYLQGFCGHHVQYTNPTPYSFPIAALVYYLNTDHCNTKVVRLSKWVAPVGTKSLLPEFRYSVRTCYPLPQGRIVHEVTMDSDHGTYYSGKIGGNDLLHKPGTALYHASEQQRL